VLALYSGWLLIAEVKSRLDPNNGGADPKKFLKAVSELGFTSVLKVYSCSSHMFA
jgi:ribosomal RNA-processing protein 8